MKRYSFFILVAVIVHGILFSIILFTTDHPGFFTDKPATGGGRGGSISVSISSYVEGSGDSHAMPGSGGFDRYRGDGAGKGQDDNAGPGAGSGSGIEGADETLARIRDKIERAKYYPALAQKNGIEGIASVYFLINKEGGIERLFIEKSSGVEILDMEALETIRRAAPYPYYPKPIQIGIRFRMSEK